MAAWCTGRARAVVFGWLAAVVVVLIAGMIAGQQNRSTFRLPGTNAQAANDLISTTFPNERGDTEAIVVSATHGTLTQGPAHQQARQLLHELRTVSGVVSVSNPLATGLTGGLAANGKTAIAVLRFRQDSMSVPASETTTLVNTVKAARSSSLNAAAMGWAVEDASASPPPFAEIVGLIAAAIVLLFAFGTGVAVAVAMGSALVSLGLSFGLLELASHVVAIPYFEPQIALTIGLGVGIDYSLLMVARYRGARQSAAAGSHATADAIARTGRTVTFAGCTVIVAMLGLLVTPLTIVRGMTIGVVLAVVPSILACNSLLPALLKLTDAHLGRGRPRFLRQRRIVERSPSWARWSQTVQRHPVPALLGALVILGLLASPILWMRLGPADGSMDNSSSMTNQAYEMASTAFGPGVTAPIDVVATFPGKVQADGPALADMRRRIAKVGDVMYIAPAVLSPSHRAAYLQVIPASTPDAAATTHLIDNLKGPLAADVAKRRIGIAVGGEQTYQLALSDAILHALPYTVLAVIASSFLLLLLQFRSIVIAVKAGVMNLLSIAAAFGLVVAIFQWGWGRQLIGVDHAGPLQSFLPLLLFPCIFGLSMDYEVFLMSRITDEWERSGDCTAAVTEGLATTGRVVTSGAAIMFALFASMALSGSRTIEMFGVGLASAVLLDATVIRSVLLPAAMQLLGRLNWWLPNWLQRRLPQIRPA